jgi:hypothetical protein
MSASDESAASRQFVAKPRFPLTKMMSKTITEDARPNWIYYAGTGVALVVIYGGIYWFEHLPSGWERGPVAGVAGVALAVAALACIGWYATREIVVSVTSEGLAVSTRRGDTFPFGDATLGLWAFGGRTKVMGTALHLRSGARHFVVGGRDHRVAEGTRLDERPQGYVDAWLWASDFDQLLAAVGRRSGVQAGREAPGKFTRCLLFPNTELAQQMSMWAVWGKQRLFRSASQPLVALDVGEDAIRVIDAANDAVIAAAARTQVTATPETYKCRRWAHGPPYKQPPPSPVLVLRVPGVEPIPIGCHDYRGGLDFSSRFEWRGKVPDRVNRPADYTVAAGDWLLLVDRFDLTPQLVDRTHRGDG